MGNESSTQITQFTREEIQLYREKYKKMEDTIMTNNETIRMLMAEKDRLTGTIDDLKTDIKKKDEDTKRRISDVHNSRKNLDSELHKYKSVPEFDAILNLNKDLVDFETKIKESIESNCDMLQTNKHDEEIEQIKKRNSELYGKLQNSSVRSLVAEKSVELKEAESELIAKKEAARQEFVKINGQLVQIKDKMRQATAKFAGTVENSISELRKNLKVYQKEVVTIENGVKTADSLMYEKVKNILLQQENALMKEMIASNVGPSTNFNTIPPKQFINNFSEKCNIEKNQFPQYMKDNTKPNNLNNDPFEQLTKGKSLLTKENVAQFDSSSEDSNSDDNFSIVDDASETCSLSGRLKSYKLILLNVNEDGNKSDEQKVRMVLRELTNLSLDDIDVRRIGKPTLRPRPIVVSFDTFNYIQELLKNRLMLRNTKFSKIRVCPYKSKPNTPKQDNKPTGPKKPRSRNKGDFTKGKDWKSSKDNNFPF